MWEKHSLRKRQAKRQRTADRRNRKRKDQNRGGMPSVSDLFFVTAQRGTNMRGDYVSSACSSGKGERGGERRPFLRRWRTHSLSRYSICALMERKSSSAHAAISLYSCSDNRRGTCFFSRCPISTEIPYSRWGLRPDFRKERPTDWKPWQPCAPHPEQQTDFLPSGQAPFPPCRPRLRQSSCVHQ